MLLTGETAITFDIQTTFDIHNGQKDGDVYETTDLRWAVFLRPDESQEVGFARSSISR